jgi:hypothetical protein
MTKAKRAGGIAQAMARVMLSVQTPVPEEKK